MNFLVTTNAANIPSDRRVIMVDGTVPSWNPRSCDFHFDHHRPGGAPVQLEEIGLNATFSLPAYPLFVTTQVDADACCAAAWILLCAHQPGYDQALMYDAYQCLYAIAHDCDHLHVPAKLSHMADFAAKAVAALKQSGDGIAKDLELPANRKDWTEAQKEAYASKCFESGTLHLMRAALGEVAWPGQSGEADEYFAKMEALRPMVYANCRIYKEVAIFDGRSIDGYVDPRLMTDWARANSSSNITLTVRDGSRQPNANLVQGYDGGLFSYTLGSVPLHSSGSPMFSERNVWFALAQLERDLRDDLGLSHPLTEWGGRNEVGGSSWRDPMITTPEQVIDLVLAL